MRKQAYGEDAELKLLGSLLIDGDAFELVYRLIKSPEYFSEQRRKDVYRAMIDLHKDQGAFDSVLIAQKLFEQKSPADSLYISDLSMNVTSGVNAESLAKVVLNSYLSDVVGEYMLKANARLVGGDDVLDIVEDLKRHIDGIQNNIPADSTVDIRTAAEEALDLIDSLVNNTDVVMKFGHKDIDRVIGGGLFGEFIVIGGKRKSGKTTLALDFLFHNARKNRRCGLFSLEMSLAQLVLRRGMIESKVKYTDVVNNLLSEDEKTRLVLSIDALSKLPILVNDKMFSLSEIESEIKSMIRNSNTKVFLIDYIQIMEPSQSNKNSRENEIATISRTLKRLAKQNNILIIALSQLNEDSKSRESRAIEMDADKLIYIESNEDEPDALLNNGLARRIDLKIVQRFGLSGGFGDVQMVYDLVYGYFRDKSSYPIITGIATPAEDDKVF